MSWSRSAKNWSSAPDSWKGWSGAAWHGTHWSNGAADWSGDWGAMDWRGTAGNRGSWGDWTGGSDSALTELSKEVVKVLRHTGRRLGLYIRSDGFARVSDLLELADIRKLGPSERMIRAMARVNEKRRFSLYEDSSGLWIRANQGHSLSGLDMGRLCGDALQELQPGETCCHGAMERHLQSILSRGLLAGGLWGQQYRQDVHFSTRHPGEKVISGMRRTAEIAVYVDLPRAVASGIAFYRSDNGVILSQGFNGVIPPEFIESVWHIGSGRQLWPIRQRTHEAVEHSHMGAESVGAIEMTGAGHGTAQQEHRADGLESMVDRVASMSLSASSY